MRRGALESPLYPRKQTLLEENSSLPESGHFVAGCFKAKSTDLTGYARLAPLRMLCPLEGTCGALLRRSLIDSPNLTTGLLEQFLYPGGSKGLFDRMAANTTANVKTASLVMGV